MKEDGYIKPEKQTKNTKKKILKRGKKEKEGNVTKERGK